MVPGSVSTTPCAHDCGRGAGGISTPPEPAWTAGAKGTAVPGVRGYDAGKKVKGRKRHPLVDTLGLLLTAVVTAASVQDRDGARLLLRHLPGGCQKLRKVWVDGGYAGRLVNWVAEHFHICLAVVLHPPGDQAIHPVAPPLGGRAHLRLAKPLASS